MEEFFNTLTACLFVGLGFVSLPLTIFFLIKLYYLEKDKENKS